MIFNSLHFLIFFPVVVLIYFVIPKKVRYIWLLIASYYFYMSWNAKYAILMATSTSITFAGGWWIQKIETSVKFKNKTRWKKTAVICSFVSNLGILGFFKYFDFFLANINAVLDNVGVELLDKPFDVLLPVGISFYTFQALSYTVDVYRGDIDAEKNILKYALFVSFFPQLVAGPIERSTNLMKQVRDVANIKLWNYQRITSGMIIMLWGYFQKMVIADRVAILVDNIYENFFYYESAAILTATVFFAIQIYCDFASYSSIAIGAAKIMGFDLMDNFNTPYLASTINDFWHRWHISLSSWFRDYLYIPLGGNRCSRVRKNVNILITFLASGFWHGANWTFIIWGGLHGLYQVIGDVLKPLKQKIALIDKWKAGKICRRAAEIVVTFILVDFAWIFFRAESFLDAIAMIEQTFSMWDLSVFATDAVYEWGLSATEFTVAIVAIILLFAVDLTQYITKQKIEQLIVKRFIVVRFVIYLTLLSAIAIFGVYGPTFDVQQFYYFQF